MSGVPQDAVRIGQLELAVPLMNGSGACNLLGEHPAYRMAADELVGLGAYVTKTVTLRPTRGNPQPWVAAYRGGTVNAVGLANPGIDEVVRSWGDPHRALGLPVFVSIAGTAAQLARVTEQLEEADWVHGIELNLSCPNVRSEGSATVAGSSPRVVAELVAEVRRLTRRPLIAKLTPAASDIAATARAAEAAGADAVCAINTLPVRATRADGSPLLGVARAGFSGPPLLGLALRCVEEASGAVSIPVVGLGGVSDEADADAMRAAGASVVAAGTAAVLDRALLGRLSTHLAGRPPAGGRLRGKGKVGEAQDAIPAAV